MSISRRLACVSMASVLVIVLSACTSDGARSAGVGDPCTPGRPGGSTGGVDCALDAGCFLGNEFYLETRSVECRTGLCLAYHWAELDSPEQRAARVYCTCHCAGDIPPEARCQCPDGYTCTRLSGVGPPEARGSLCVRVP